MRKRRSRNCGGVLLSTIIFVSHTFSNPLQVSWVNFLCAVSSESELTKQQPIITTIPPIIQPILLHSYPTLYGVLIRVASLLLYSLLKLHRNVDRVGCVFAFSVCLFSVLCSAFVCNVFVPLLQQPYVQSWRSALATCSLSLFISSSSLSDLCL